MITACRLDADWPEVEARLRGFLTGQGAVGALAEDIVQEVAARALASGLRYGSADELVRWGCTVARNLLVTEHRRARRPSPPPGQERAARASTDAQALDRLDLERTMTAISRLSSRDQDVLLSQLESPPPAPAVRDRRADVRANVALFRARGRLLRLLAAITAPLVLRWQRCRSRLEVDGLVAIAVFGAALPVAYVSLGDDGGPPADPPAAALHPRGGAPAAPPPVAAPPVVPAGGRPVATVRATAHAARSRPVVTTNTTRSLVSAPPATAVGVATPAGDQVVGVREKEEDDHLVCVDEYLVLPEVCAGD